MSLYHSLRNFLRRHVTAISITAATMLMVSGVFLFVYSTNLFAIFSVITAYFLLLGITIKTTSVWKHAAHMEASIEAQAMKIVEANQQLSESRIFLKNIINKVADPIFVKDRQHRWIVGNTALWNLFGKQEAELLGKSDYDFFPKEEADVFRIKDEEVFSTGKTNINIENFTDASGVTHIISTKKSLYVTPGGEEFLVGVIRDMSEALQMQNKLRESDDARLKSIMDYSGRPVYIKDLEGKYLRANKDIVALCNLREEDMIGKTDHDFFPATFADAFRKNDLAVIAKKAAIEFEELAPHSDGVHTYTTVKFPLFDAGGAVYAVCGISTDITDKKAAEAKLLNYMEQLEHSNRELDDFAYIASHDLKEPLRGLHNQASFLLEDYGTTLTEDAVRRLKRMSTLCVRMEQLINDLHYFSRLGRTDLAVQNADPNIIVHEIRQMMESTLKEQNAQIVIPSPMPNLVCDRPRITEVFRNLITNAIKYNDKKEKIVEIGYKETVLCLSGLQKNLFYIKDNGIGIESEFYDEIFRIFKRLPYAGSVHETGTGVGLTFVKKIIERHSGHIWLESEPGVGTTFYFNLGDAKA